MSPGDVWIASVRSLRVEWVPALVVSSPELIETCVATGFGVGVTVAIPGMKESPGLRRLQLPGLDSLDVGALWARKANPLIRMLVEAFEKQALGLIRRSSASLAQPLS